MNSTVLDRSGSRLRALPVVALVAMLLGVCLAPGAVAAPADDAATPGVDRFGSCLAAQHTGQVLLLIDQSRSLTASDPQGARVTAARYLAEQLNSFARTTAAELEIGVAGFADSYRSHLDWTRLEDSSLDQVRSAIGQAGERTDGLDTDYWLALDGARTALAHRRGDHGDQACQMIAWFTDGELDFTPRPGVTREYAPGQSVDTQADVDRMRQAAQTSICRTAGLADQIRSSGIVTMAIGLKPPNGQAGDFDLLRSIATGDETAAGSCGNVHEPAPGDFILADNIDDLLFAFDRISTPGQPPLTQERGACLAHVCEEGKHVFVLDRSVGSVSILASADQPGLTPVLVAPDGQEIPMAPGHTGSAAPGGVAVDWRFPTDRSVAVAMSNSSAPRWTGVWALVFIAADDDSARTRSSIHITGDLRPVWTNASDALHAGATDMRMTFGVQNSARRAVDTTDARALPGSATLTTTLVVGGREIRIGTDVDKGRITAPQTLDLAGVEPGPATLRMTLQVTTAAARNARDQLVPGTRLAPFTVEQPVTVDPPVGYPRLAGRADFGTVEGAGTGTAALRVTGPGCVWLDPSKPPTFLGAPDGAGDLTITADAQAQSGCVKVADGAEGTLDLRLAVPNSVNGTVNGTLTVMVAPADGSAAPLPVSVPFTAALEKPVNTTGFVITLVVALILGPLIPLLMLYLVKWLTARIPGRGLRAEQIPVRVDGTTVLRGTAPFAIGDTDFVRLVPGLNGPTRAIDLDGITLRTRIGRSPFGTGYVVVSAPGQAGAAGKSALWCGTTPDARLPLAIHNTWFVLHDPRGPESAATVVLLAGDDATREQIERLCRDMTEALPRVLPRLRAEARKRLGDDAGPEGAEPGGNPFGPAAPGSPQGNPFGPPGPAPVGNPFGGGGAPGGNPGSGNPGSGNPFGPPPAGRPSPSRGNPSGHNPYGHNPFGAPPPGRTAPPDNPFRPPGPSPGSGRTPPGNNPFHP
ncbi:MAG: VWA domain-containing protein [Gordonia sp. (in: high G+C Gram-positive bacteria)]